jgi:integrase
VRDVVQAAGVPQGSFTNHFTSKEAFGLEILARSLRHPDKASRHADGTRVEPIGGPTAERIVHLLSAFYRWAIREGYATHNPCKGLQRDAGMAKMLRSTHTPDSSVVLQSRKDVDRIYRAIPVHYVHKVRQSRKPHPVGNAKPRSAAALNPVPIAYLISAMAGLRPGEVVPLRWSDIDFERRVMHVRRNYRNGEISLPKSGKGREVPIVPHLLKELQGWRKLIPEATLVCPPVRNSTRGDTCFVGTPLIKKMLDQACDSCHISRGHFYDLGRRTFATLAAKAGLSPYRLKEIMGHASIETTMRYVRFAGALTDDEISALDLAS